MSRADPLPPDQRRSAIITAVIPLLARRGAAVTTREMAEAAGVAEGTIFSVFEDKTALIRSALATAMDPAPVVKALSEIHDGAPIEVQLAEAARILLERLEVFFSLAPLVRSLPISPAHMAEGQSRMAAASSAINIALTTLFERYAGRLRLPPATAAAVFAGLVSARGISWTDLGQRLGVAEMVDTFLFGVAEPSRVGGD